MGISDTEHTIAVVWVCCLLSIVIMAARLILGRWCKKKFDIGDTLTCLAIFLSFARIAFTHVIVLWRTNNIYPSLGQAGIDALGPDGVRRHELGSKFTLVARTLYITLLWIQKSVLLVFYRVLVQDIPWGKKTARPFWVILGATYITDIVVTFTGCRPFDHYWKVLPQTDRCTEAIPQLFVVGGTNMATDILLIILPIPVLLGVRLNWQKKLQLGFLFSVGFVIIAVTAVRLPRTLQNATSETTRITWTTGESLAATFVANAPTLYSFRLRFRQNKIKVRQLSRSGPHVRASVPSADLAGTTLTEFGDSDEYSSSPRAGSQEITRTNDVEMAEGGGTGKAIRKQSVGKLQFSTSTDKSNK